MWFKRDKAKTHLYKSENQELRNQLTIGFDALQKANTTMTALVNENRLLSIQNATLKHENLDAERKIRRLSYKVSDYKKKFSKVQKKTSKLEEKLDLLTKD